MLAAHEGLTPGTIFIRWGNKTDLERSKKEIPSYFAIRGNSLFFFFRNETSIRENTPIG